MHMEPLGLYMEVPPEMGTFFQASGIWKGSDFTICNIWKGRKSVISVGKKARKG